MKVNGVFVMTRRDVELNEYLTEAQSSQSILMVAPTDFSFNIQTSSDNVYMNNITVTAKDVLLEFYELYSKLKNEGINIHLFCHEVYHNTPDAIFPNNWFSTHKLYSRSTICIYPMKAPNRRNEKRKDLIEYLETLYPNVVDLSSFENNNPPKALESTGSLVLDRRNKKAFMAESERSHNDTAREWAKYFQYELISFNSYDESGKPIYHTNVVVSIGTEWVVICLEVIPENQREKVKLAIESLKKKLSTYLKINKKTFVLIFSN